MDLNAHCTHKRQRCLTQQRCKNHICSKWKTSFRVFYFLTAILPWFFSILGNVGIPWCINSLRPSRDNILGTSSHLGDRQSVREERCGRAMEIKLELFASYRMPLVQRVFEDNGSEKMLRYHIKSLSHCDNKSRHRKPVQEGWRISPSSDV